ncbi:MAG: hypothetical protein CMJ48_11040 [Planctomycetaceae bacterium]|nr:hypothetical protein [Planctomycetaceae bacterium]
MNDGLRLPLSLKPDTLNGVMTDPQPQPHRRKHRPWLFVAAAFLVLLSVGLSFLLPYYQQWKVVQKIEADGGQVMSTSVGPDWLHDWLPEEWSNALSQITWVGARENRLFGDEHLLRVCIFDEILALNLDRTQVSDAGLQHLRGLSDLEYLWLEGTRVTDAGLKHLEGSSKLKGIWLEGTQVTPKGVKQLQEALPKCKIHD